MRPESAKADAGRGMHEHMHTYDVPGQPTNLRPLHTSFSGLLQEERIFDISKISYKCITVFLPFLPCEHMSTKGSS
jgi:hypothetical protein